MRDNSAAQVSKLAQLRALHTYLKQSLRSKYTSLGQAYVADMESKGFRLTTAQKKAVKEKARLLSAAAVSDMDVAGLADGARRIALEDPVSVDIDLSVPDEEVSLLDSTMRSIGVPCPSNSCALPKKNVLCPANRAAIRRAIDNKVGRSNARLSNVPVNGRVSNNVRTGKSTLQVPGNGLNDRVESNDDRVPVSPVPSMGPLNMSLQPAGGDLALRQNMPTGGMMGSGGGIPQMNLPLRQNTMGGGLMGGGMMGGGIPQMDLPLMPNMPMGGFGGGLMGGPQMDLPLMPNMPMGGFGGGLMGGPQMDLPLMPNMPMGRMGGFNPQMLDSALTPPGYQFNPAPFDPRRNQENRRNEWVEDMQALYRHRGHPNFEPFKDVVERKYEKVPIARERIEQAERGHRTRIQSNPKTQNKLYIRPDMTKEQAVAAYKQALRSGADKAELKRQMEAWSQAYRLRNVKGRRSGRAQTAQSPQAAAGQAAARRAAQSPQAAGVRAEDQRRVRIPQGSSPSSPFASPSSMLSSRQYIRPDMSKEQAVAAYKQALRSGVDKVQLRAQMKAWSQAYRLRNVKGRRSGRAQTAQSPQAAAGQAAARRAAQAQAAQSPQAAAAQAQAAQARGVARLTIRPDMSKEQAITAYKQAIRSGADKAQLKQEIKAWSQAYRLRNVKGRRSGRALALLEPSQQPRPMDRDWRSVLGVTATDTPETIRKKYQMRLRSAHPNRGGTADAFRAVRGAWEAYQRQHSIQQQPASSIRSVIRPDTNPQQAVAAYQQAKRSGVDRQRVEREMEAWRQTQRQRNVLQRRTGVPIIRTDMNPQQAVAAYKQAIRSGVDRRRVEREMGVWRQAQRQRNVRGRRQRALGFPQRAMSKSVSSRQSPRSVARGLPSLSTESTGSTGSGSVTNTATFRGRPVQRLARSPRRSRSFARGSRSSSRRRR